MTQTTKNLITLKEAAEQTGVKADTLKNYARRGKIRAFKMAGTRWFIDADSLSNLYEPVGEEG